MIFMTQRTSILWAVTRLLLTRQVRLALTQWQTAQDVYVRVPSTSGGMNDSKKLTIKSSDIFEINKFGFEDEDMTKFKRIDVTKNFNYSDEVTFVAATYNNLGALTSIALKKAYGDQLTIGANKVTMSLDLPDTFDKVNDKFNAFVLTSCHQMEKQQLMKI